MVTVTTPLPAIDCDPVLAATRRAGVGDTVTLTTATAPDRVSTPQLLLDWSAPGRSRSPATVVTVTITNNGSSDLSGSRDQRLLRRHVQPRHGHSTPTMSRHHDFSGTAKQVDDRLDGTTQLVITLGAASGGTTSGVAAAHRAYRLCLDQGLAGNGLSTTPVNGTSSRF